MSKLNRLRKRLKRGVPQRNRDMNNFFHPKPIDPVELAKNIVSSDNDRNNMTEKERLEYDIEMYENAGNHYAAMQLKEELANKY